MAAAHPSECAAVVTCDRGVGEQMTPAANGTDERLDAVLDVLRAIREALEVATPAKTAAPAKRKRGTERVCGSWPDDPADVIE